LVAGLRCIWGLLPDFQCDLPAERLPRCGRRPSPSDQAVPAHRGGTGECAGCAARGCELEPCRLDGTGFGGRGAALRVDPSGLLPAAPAHTSAGSLLHRLWVPVAGDRGCGGGLPAGLALVPAHGGAAGVVPGDREKQGLAQVERVFLTVPIVHL